MASPEFRTDFEPRHGQAVPVVPGVMRITAANASPFTFHGTNSYIIGEKELAVVDPGPADEAHYEALLAAIAGRPVTHILVTHTHMDHSPLARPLAEATGARIAAEGPHRPARPLNLGEVNPLEASSDTAFSADMALADGETIENGEWRIEAVHTPGHTANHCVFALAGQDIIFSGDHVMAWSTSIVAPPDGAMSDYMASLERMLERPETTYLPGHGGRLSRAREFVRALRAHRRMREAAILARIQAGDRTVAAIVERIYRDTDPRLHRAAGLAVLAHLEDLVAGGRVAADGDVSLQAEFRPA